eukprot:4996937-Ditylum_brightwellii.AAC.1
MVPFLIQKLRQSYFQHPVRLCHPSMPAPKGRKTGNLLIGYPELLTILTNGKDSKEASPQI